MFICAFDNQESGGLTLIFLVLIFQRLIKIYSAIIRICGYNLMEKPSNPSNPYVRAT